MNCDVNSFYIPVTHSRDGNRDVIQVRMVPCSYHSTLIYTYVSDNPTSLPAPGRKVLTLMVFPGAGNGDSIRLLMKG